MLDEIRLVGSHKKGDALAGNMVADLVVLLREVPTGKPPSSPPPTHMRSQIPTSCLCIMGLCPVGIVETVQPAWHVGWLACSKGGRLANQY